MKAVVGLALSPLTSSSPLHPATRKEAAAWVAAILTSRTAQSRRGGREASADKLLKWI